MLLLKSKLEVGQFAIPFHKCETHQEGESHILYLQINQKITVPIGISGAIFLYLFNKYLCWANKLIISKTFFNLFSYISLGVIALLLLLVYAHITPPSVNYYTLIFAILLLTARLFIRIFYIKKNRNNNKGG